MYICQIICIYLLVTHTYAIQNGTLVSNSTQYPFFAYIGYPRLCGATFISFNPTWMLTAAHCLVNASMTPSHEMNYIMYGNTTRSTSHLAPIQSWIIHPQYAKNNSDYDHDIAVVKIKDDSLNNSSDVYRIPLLSNVNTLQVGQLGYVMGYGYTSLGGGESTELRQIEETLVSIGAQNSSELMIAKSPPYSGVCHGDSGECGPLIIQQNGVWTVAGVTARILNAYDPNPDSPTCPVSYDESQASENGYVSVGVMLDWIANATSLSIAELMEPPSAVSVNGTTASPDNSGYQTTNSSQRAYLSNLTVMATFWFVTLVIFC